MSGPFPVTAEGYRYSFNAMCKKTGKRWRGNGKLKSDSEYFFMKLVAKLNNTACPAGSVETLLDHGGESISKNFQY